MKRGLLLLCILLLLLAAACQRIPAFAPDTDARWGETPAPSSMLPPLPSPTPAPAPVTGDVEDLKLTLSFYFGERTGLYSGALVNDLPHGYGSFIAANLDGVGWMYEGHWDSGHFSGLGQCFWADGSMEEGEYLNDELHGEGREYIDGVLRYEGGYAAGHFDGQGTLYGLSGIRIYTGAFRNGYIVEDAAAREARISAFKQRCAAPDYAALYSGAEAAASDCVQVSGTVCRVFAPYPDAPYYCSFLMADAATQQNVVSVNHLLSTDEVLPVVGQSVTVWGTADTLYTYTTQLNSPVSVPQVEAWSVEKGEYPDGFEA